MNLDGASQSPTSFPENDPLHYWLGLHPSERVAQEATYIEAYTLLEEAGHLMEAHGTDRASFEASAFKLLKVAPTSKPPFCLVAPDELVVSAVTNLHRIYFV
jgi:hypothetical protein